MLLDSQHQLNELQHSREARKRSPKNKSMKSLLKSYDKFSDFLDNNPSPQRRVTFLSSPEESINLVEKYSKKHYEKYSMEKDWDIADSPTSSSTNDSTNFNEVPSLFTAIVRLVNGNVVKCIPVKLMMNMHQFQDLRTDSKRLKVFKKKLQPLILELLSAEDKVKSWTIDSIEPYDNEISSDKCFTDYGVTKEKPVSRDKHCTRNNFYFEPFDSQNSMDFSATSSPYRVETSYDSEMSLENERKNNLENDLVNCEPTEDLSWQHTLHHSPIDHSCKNIIDESGARALRNRDFIKREIQEKTGVCSYQDSPDSEISLENERKNNSEEDVVICEPTEDLSWQRPLHHCHIDHSSMKVMDEFGATTLQNHDCIKREIPEKTDVCSDQDLFALLYNLDCKPDVKSVETGQTSATSGIENRMSEKEIVQMEVATASSAISENFESKFNLSELLDKWDEESRFLKCTKSAKELNETMQFNTPENCGSYGNNISPNSKTEIVSTSAVKNYQSSDFKCPSSNLQSNSCLIKKENFQLGSLSPDEHSNCNSYAAFEEDLHMKHPGDRRKENRFSSSQNNECLNRLNNCTDRPIHHQSQSHINNTSILTENSIKGYYLEENKQLNMSMSENDASVHYQSDLWNSDIVVYELPVASDQPSGEPPKFNKVSSSINKTTHPLRSSVLSSHLQNCSPVEPALRPLGSSISQSSSIPKKIPKQEPIFQSYDSTLAPNIYSSYLPFESNNESRSSLGETSKQIKSSSQRRSMKKEPNLRSLSFPTPSDLNETLLISPKNSLAEKAFSNQDERNLVSQDSSVHSHPKPMLHPNSAPVSLNRKTTCSIFISSKLKFLSKNKSLIATGRPVPKRKEIPFLMKGKLKKKKFF